MNRIIKTAVIAAIAGIGVIGTAGAAQAFTPTAGPARSASTSAPRLPIRHRRDDDDRERST